MIRATIKIVAAVAVLLMAASTGFSAVRVVTDQRTYPVSGKTGAELYASMRKKAPRRTIFTQDLAQVSFAFTIRHGMGVDGRACSIRNGTFDVKVTATDPQVIDKLLPKTSQAWARLLAEMHRTAAARTRIARQSMRDLMDATLRLKTANDPTCTKIRGHLNRLRRKALADHDASQHRFSKENAALGRRFLEELAAAK
jgi:predicted secreted Zn-dependent protease